MAAKLGVFNRPDYEVRLCDELVSPGEGVLEHRHFDPGGATAKNPEDPFDNEAREKEMEAVNKIAAQVPKREVFLEAEKEANPLFPLDTVKEEAKFLHMMQPDIHAATVSGHDDVVEWSSSDDEDQVISIDLPPGYQPRKPAERPGREGCCSGSQQCW